MAETVASAGATLDAGALIGFERAQRHVVALIGRALERGAALAVPAGVVAQVWRDPRRQVRLARLLAAPLVDVVALDDKAARASGQLCGAAGTSDVVDASVVWCARERGHPVVTGEPDGLRALDPQLAVVGV